MLSDHETNAFDGVQDSRGRHDHQLVLVEFWPDTVNLCDVPPWQLACMERKGRVIFVLRIGWQSQLVNNIRAAQQCMRVLEAIANIRTRS